MIEWTRLSELREEIGADDFAAVVELFFVEVDRIMDKLTPGATNLEEMLHELKGCALNLGFEEFSELCQEGETAAASGSGDSVDIVKLRRVYFESRTEFNSGIRGLSPR